MSEAPSSIKRFDYIDALRGYAILMVIAVHVSQAYPDLPNWLSKVLSQGARGVQLFFVTSALTLSMSWVARNEGANEFFTRRFFRIVPMFWVAIVGFLWLGGTGPSIYAPDGIGIRHIVMTALLVHGFWPDTITSVVPGGWSVADEVIFYALFPAFVPRLLNANWKTLIAVAVAAVVLGAQVSRLLDGFSYLLPSSAQQAAGIYFFLWFPRQLPCFVFGIMLFKFSLDRKVPTAVAKRVCVLAIALMLLVPFIEGIKYALPLGLATTYAIAFTLFAFSLMYWRGSPLVSRPIMRVGKVSYSAYFVHFAVLHYMPALHPTEWPSANVACMYAAVTFVTVCISSITYLTIEKPMIRLGSVLIAARRSPRADVNMQPEGNVAG